MCILTGCKLNDYLIYTYYLILGYKFYYFEQKLSNSIVVKDCDKTHLLRHQFNLNLAHL